MTPYRWAACAGCVLVAVVCGIVGAVESLAHPDALFVSPTLGGLFAGGLGALVLIGTREV